MHTRTTNATPPEVPTPVLSRPPAQWRRALRRQLSQPATRDAVAIGAIALAAFFLIEGTEICTEAFEFIQKHPELELDAAVLAGILSAIGMLAFSIRRWRDLRREVIAREAAEAKAHEVAVHDALTGLPNRRRLREEAARAVAGAARGGGPVALMMVDLDRFKSVNDLHGHPAGDRLLQEVAVRLRAAGRGGDTVARLGGDEFAIIAALGSGDPSKQASRLARRLVAALEEPFKLVDCTVRIGCCVGVAMAPQDAADVEALMRRADLALYRAKAEGRGCFRFFEAGMDVRIRERAALEADLRVAIAHDELVPYFQPLVEIGSERILGFEALARWLHPTRGLVPPTDFIPIAEDAGLIVPLTGKLLRKACRAAATWPGQLSIAVNVSPLQLRDRSLPGIIRSVLEQTGLAANRLEIELTESALVGDLDLARDVMDRLKAIGVRLVLDDFGTGYSSLAHLQALPFDKIKIDASFVRAMAHDPGSRKIVAAVVGLGHSLGLPIVAEGVEEERDAETLRELGCDAGQGWLYGRPVPAETVAAMLAGETEIVASLVA